MTIIHVSFLLYVDVKSVRQPSANFVNRQNPMSTVIKQSGILYKIIFAQSYQLPLLFVILGLVSLIYNHKQYNYNHFMHFT